MIDHSDFRRLYFTLTAKLMGCTWKTPKINFEAFEVRLNIESSYGAFYGFNVGRIPTEFLGDVEKAPAS